MAEAVKVKHDGDQGGVSKAVALPGAVSRLGEYPRRFREFLHEVRTELRNVTWPTMNDVRATTTVVIVTVLFFGFFLFLVDQGAGRLVEQVFRTLKR